MNTLHAKSSSLFCPLILSSRVNLKYAYALRPRYASTSTQYPVPSLPLFQRALRDGHYNRTAVVNYNTEELFTYGDLLEHSGELASRISSSDLKEERVSFLCPANYDYVRSQWAIWRAGGVCVPLCTSHPAAELEYVLRDSASSTVIAAPEYVGILKPIAEKLGLRFLQLDSVKSGGNPRPKPSNTFNIEPTRRALIIYTSGTTGPPKGVVTTHRSIQAQVESLVKAWEWSSNDRILQVLPLHHVHGVINVLTCALWSGAICEMMTKFDAQKVWARFTQDPPLTLFMAVPTIYSKLIHEYESFPSSQQVSSTEALKKLRLMVSGSMALPAPIMDKWAKISGHQLLERYGMTEIGMALSNPLKGDRIAGSVGFPLPGVTVSIAEGTGELMVKGDTVFQEYWNKPEATKKTFTEDGWFLTGDIAAADKTGRYSILGRASVDIIKSGGYKISALDIERILLAHPRITECAVVGVPDLEWGQTIGVIVVLRDGGDMSVDELRTWAKDQLASYKLPRHIKVLKEMPKNAMGKMNKKELVKEFDVVNAKK